MATFLFFPSRLRFGAFGATITSTNVLRCRSSAVVFYIAEMEQKLGTRNYSDVYRFSLNQFF